MIRKIPFLRIGRDCIEGERNSVQLKRKFGNSGNIINIKGENNLIESHGKVVKSKFRINGNGNVIRIAYGCKISASTIVVIGSDCTIDLHEGATMGSGCWITLMGKDKKVVIGKDAMIADGVDLWASDSHPIFQDGHMDKVVNPSGNIIIDEHVWVGKRAAILKNVRIGKNSIIGMGSVVTKSVPESCLAVGNPARIIKQGVNWGREHIRI